MGYTQTSGVWGGGGHAKAAGATVKLPFAEAVKLVSEALDREISAARRA